jgi:hypothetical protein
LIHLLKALVFIVRTGFFASDSTSAVHDQFPVFLVGRQFLFNYIEGFTERIHIRCDGIFKVADLTLIVVTHIYEQGIRILDKGVELFCVYMYPFIRDIETIVVESVCDNFFPHLYLEFQKRFGMMFYGDIQPDIFQESYAVQVLLECREIISRQGELGINPFMGDKNPAQYFHPVPVYEEMVPQDLRISYACIFVKRKGQAFLAGLFYKGFPFFCT